MITSLPLPQLKYHRIPVTLVLLLTAIILVPLVTSWQLHAQTIFVSVLVLCGLLALVERAWIDVFLTAVVVIVIGTSHLTLPTQDIPTRLIALFGLMAYLGLNLILLIGPWTRFVPQLIWIYKYRRHLGVTVFLLALSHASLIFSLYFSYNFSNLFLYTLPTLGFIALFILTILAVTSSDKIQKRFNLLHWEIIHLCLLVLYACILSFILTQMGSTLDFKTRLFLVAILLYWLLISPLALPKRMLRYVNGWKQLHLLLYAAYFSVIMHVWLARVSTEVISKRIGFLALTTFVIGSHVIGWIVFFVKRHKEQTADYETATINRQTYFRVGKVDDFQEGRGTKITRQKTEIALFKLDGKIFALDNRCPHQGGPLSEGRIKNGYVECPWHQYQFSVLDGKGPAGYEDEVTSHPVIVEDGHVFVKVNTEDTNSESLPKCARQDCCSGRPAQE